MTTIDEQGTSLWQDAWIKLSKNYLALFGLAIIGFLCVVPLLTPWIAPYGYEEQNLLLGATSPSAEHWLGTDIFGRDMLTRIMYGGRVSLTVGFIATAVALAIGVLWGAVAGFVGGRVDAVMMRIVDIMYALPFMIFIVLLMVVFGRNILLLFLAIGAVEWLTMARIVRGQVMALRKRSFSRPIAVDHYSATYYSQYIGASNCLHHLDHTQRNATRSLFKFSGPGYTATPELMGITNKLRCRNHGRVSMATYLSRRNPVANIVCTQLSRRWFT